MFLRQHGNPQTEIRGVDESHIIFATVLDSDDARGVWIELTADKQKQASAVERFNLLIPWSQILTIIVAEQFSTEIRQEARKIGFTGETERERIEQDMARAVASEREYRGASRQTGGCRD